MMRTAGQQNFGLRHSEKRTWTTAGLSWSLGHYTAAALVAFGIALTPSAPAVAQKAGFSTKAKQAILVDATSNAVLFAKNADELMSPASMSKLMTLAVIFKGLKSGQLKLDDSFEMSVNAWRTGGAPSGTSAMMVPVNTEETLEQLLKGIIIQSGNDAAIALAEGLAGSEAAFAEIMTEQGRQIGLENSTFRNATGLYNPEHLTTARDLARLAQHIIDTYPEYYKWFAEKEFAYRKHRFRNRNPLLYLDIGVDGLKTGYVSQAGYGLVSSAQQNGRRLIAVVNGLSTRAERKRESRRLIEWGFRGFSQFKLFNEGAVIGQARVWGGSQFFVELTGKGPVTVVLPRYPADQKLRAQIVYDGPLKPPIAKGAKVASLRVRSSTGAVNEVPLYAATDIETAGVVWRGLDSVFHLAFGWLP
ncbi:MAG: D-alanyl-D-alanine carboxypeptidase family protein [Pseudomonadota bacterium]